MKTVSGYYFLLLFVLLSSGSLRAADSWPEAIVEWFTALFADDVPVEIDSPDRQLRDSLRLTPSGLLLNEVPLTDTLARNDWPLLSLGVGAELERRARLLSETVVLTDPAGKLPFGIDRPVRIVYATEQRPVRLIEMARRFTSVQEVPFDDLVAAALPVAADLPTVIVADDPIGRGTGGTDWYRALTDWTPSSPVIFIHFGDAALLTGLPPSWTLINCPLRVKESELFLAQALFGAHDLSGYLSVATPTFAAGRGYHLAATRPGFRDPELLGIDRTRFERLDYTINRAIRYRATPGAELLVMKDGQVVYEKAYGYQTYQRKRAVDVGQLYDLASVTKAAATSLAVMKLYEDGKIDLKARVRDYLPEYKKKVVGGYRIDQLLTHHTGLQPDLPLYGLIGKQFVSDTLSEEFSLRLSDTKWLDATIPGRVRTAFNKVAYTRRPVYRYSDINYVLLQFVVEEITQTSLSAYVREHFYDPMGLRQLTFLPSRSFPAYRIVPTVTDNWMRGGLVRGYPHDEGAALLGGVAGHAGLFSNAHDLGQLFQLLNNKGSYAGRQILSPETVALFTARGPYNYRALGFDRLAAGWGNVISAGASLATVGHTGFTGTCVWADPETNLVYVLLTNRIHPDPKNERLLNYGTRGTVHRDIYRALGSFDPGEA